MTRFVGITRKKTRNRALLQGGERAYLSCAADLLLTGLFEDLSGEAACPVCGKRISLEVRGRKLVDLTPAGAVLHYVRFKTDNPKAFGVLCEDTFIFDDRRCLVEWEKSYAGPKGRVVAPDEFLNEMAEAKGLPR